MNIREELEKLNNERSELQSRIAVAESKINDLCSILGVEPDLAAISKSKEEIESLIADSEAKLTELLKQYESLRNGADS